MHLPIKTTLYASAHYSSSCQLRIYPFSVLLAIRCLRVQCRLCFYWWHVLHWYLEQQVHHLIVYSLMLFVREGTLSIRLLREKNGSFCWQRLDVTLDAWTWADNLNTPGIIYLTMVCYALFAITCRYQTLPGLFQFWMAPIVHSNKR